MNRNADPHGVKEALQLSEERFTTFANSIAALAWMANADGWITWYNRCWYEYTGTTPEAMEGWGWHSVHDPKVLPRVMERWASSIRTAQPFQMVFPLRGVDGVFRAFLTHATPVRNLEGKVTQWVGTNTEVDELQRTRDALERSGERLRLALEAVPGMGTFDWNVAEERIFLDARLARLFSVSAEAVTAGVRPSELTALTHPDDRARVEQAIDRAVSTGGAYAADYRMLQPDDAVRWLSARGQCLLDVEGRPVRFTGTILDITDRKLTEQVLVQNEKLAAVGRVAASIAHEINNPLDAAINLLFLARHSIGQPECLGYLETADEQVRAASAITLQTLRFHRQSTKATPVACEDMLPTVLSLYQGKMRAHGIAVEQRMRPAAPVPCYEGEVRQVLSNLIGNAVDAMIPRPGRLLLRARQGCRWATEDRGVVLTVADTGPGMSRQTARRAFEPFFTTKEAAGTGLGLWISQEIVSRHGGSLRFRSTQHGARTGTVFTVFLPFEARVRE